MSTDVEPMHTKLNSERAFGQVARIADAFSARWIAGILTILAFILFWQLTPILGLVDKQLVPPASTVLARYFAQIVEPAFYANLAVTLNHVLGGFGLAILVAIPIGLAMGYWTIVNRTLSLTIEVLRPIPPSSLVPIFAILLGIGNSMHIAVVFFAAVIPLLMATVDGVRAVDPVLINTARTLGRTTTDIFRTVLLPAAMPHVATGLRISITIALLVGIASEMLILTEGLGRRIVYAQRVMDISGLYAGLITLATVGFLLNWTCQLLEGYFLRWHMQSKAKNWS